MEMADSSSALDVSADLKFMHASNVNVSNFVSVKLSGRSNYKIWKGQMLCLIKSQVLLHIIDPEHPFPVDKGVHMIEQYNELVKGWIFGSVNENVLNDVVDSSTAQEVWMKLESHYNSPLSDHSDRQGDSSNTFEVSTQAEDLEYTRVSNVNVSNFVSVKLSGRNNYNIWKAQMLCLIKSQALLHLVDAKCPFPVGKGVHMIAQYNELVKGWIFGSMHEQVLKDFIRVNSVQVLWEILETLLWDTRDDIEDQVEFVFHTELLAYPPELEDADNIRRKRLLYVAAVEGYWWKAKSILKVHKKAATEAIKGNGDTILHVAVEVGQNYFVEKLVDFLENRKDIETQNSKGRTALHIAAMVDNARAAQLLVQKSSQLLVIRDHNDDTPTDIAFSDMKFNTSAYFLKSTTSFYSINLNVSEDNATKAMVAAIYTKQYDLAVRLLQKFCDIARNNSIILFMFVITFPTDLGLTESVIYPSFHSVLQKTVARCSLLFHSNFWDKCVDIVRVVKISNNKCCSWLGNISMILLVPIATLYPIYQLICLLILVLHLTFSMLYFLLWKILAITVRPIKNIEKKKKRYREARMILSLICDQMGTSKDDYSESIIEAVQQGTYEVVDEILFRAPSTMDCKDKDGYNIIQLAITNRSEKVYNLLYHIIERSRSYRLMVDSSGNNLAHLAGRLAPSVVLSRTTGAALQLQRELLWREELEKIMLPLNLIEKNINEETPAMIFTREHRDLMKEGESWMKTTAESCSITAALIVTIVFAAAITVPGGNNQESGIPLLKKEIAFTIFAVSNAFSLFTASTALLLFLSILTARFSERDFLAILPKRLIFGLVTLFLSTTAMIVAFGAILFLVFCDKRPWMLVPIFGFACLPISVMVTIKVPLLVDFIQSTYFPVLGRKSSVATCKVNPKSTIFMR